MKTIFTTIAFTLILAACSNPMQTVVTDSNKEQILNDVYHSKNITLEDKNLFSAFMLRSRVSSILNEKPNLGVIRVSYSGKTVAQIIEEERTFQIKQKQEEIKLANETKMKFATDLANLNQSLTVTTFQKRESDFSSVSYLGLIAKNNSGKEIRGFTGHLRVLDMFGDELENEYVKVTQKIPSKEKITWEEFIDNYSIQKASIKDLKFEWRTEHIVFSDGSEISIKIDKSS